MGFDGMPGSLQMRFAAYATTSMHIKAVSLARDAINDWLSRCSNPYVSISGGKDSLCVLHLVRGVMPECPAVYWDADCAFPEVEELLSRMRNVEKFKTTEPFFATLTRHGLDGGTELERDTMRTTVWEPVSRYINERKRDGGAYGLRMEESYGRRMHGLTRGAVFYSKTYQVWMCQPITRWKYNDVWAYILTNNIEYPAVYDKMWEMPEREQRISYWAGETNRQYGRYAWLKKHYPGLWNKLAAAFPEVRGYA